MHKVSSEPLISIHISVVSNDSILLADSEDTDQTARMRRLIWPSLPAYAQRHVFLHDTAQMLCEVDASQNE